MTDGSFVDIASIGDSRLRWRRPDGTMGALTRTPDGSWTNTLGWTDRPDGTRISFDCARNAIAFNALEGRRLNLAVSETRFSVQGASLAGRLVMPEGDSRVPIVVLVHGAERDSALDDYALQRMFPAAGIGAFVYDKRGTGASGGRYTHDYLTLAVDAIAAMREAKRLAGTRAGRVGYQAGSQGGWVAPLAATIAPVDFVIVSFGLAVSPLAAERESIATALTRRGFGADVVEQGMALADAIDVIATSNFTQGYDGLEAIRSRYGDAPWFRQIRNGVAGFSRFILDTPPSVLRVEGPQLVPQIPLHYDPMPVLRHLDTPQLWVLAGDDQDAPPGETKRRLANLTREGRPITVALFPDTEHGLYEYETLPDGSRVSTRLPAGYFPMMRDFVLNGFIGSGYGAETTRPGDESGG
ncbi:MAG TPA: alpha/beta hydrolase [Pseudomonadales bacterium]